MPQLQLALDMPDLDEARRIAQAAAASVDIIEADIRIARAGGKLAAMAVAAGADIVSIVA